MMRGGGGGREGKGREGRGGERRGEGLRNKERPSQFPTNF